MDGQANVKEINVLRAIISDCMKEMPCGNITTHTPENLAGRIGELAQELAVESLENENLRKVLANLVNNNLIRDLASINSNVFIHFDAAKKILISE